MRTAGSTSSSPPGKPQPSRKTASSESPSTESPSTESPSTESPSTESPSTEPRSGKPASTRTPSRDVELALVDAAERVLASRGPEAVTVRAVATEAGVAPMGVYNRFGGKDGLVDAVLTRGFIALRAAITPQGESDPGERLLASGMRYREFALGHPARYLAMFDDTLHQETTAEEVMEHARAAFEELVGHVQYGMVCGTVADGDAEDVAQQIWSAVHGAVQLEIKGLLQVDDAERNYRSLLDTLYRGLPPGPAAR